jgi:hypothetical protein
MTKAFKTSFLVLSLVLGNGALASPAHATGTTPTSRVATSTPGTGTATITWAGVANATNYQARVLIGKVPIKTSTSLAANSRTYTFIGLEYGVPIKLQVRSMDGTWSSWGVASPDPITPVAAAPSAPGQPTLSVIEDKRIKVEWAVPSSDGGSPIASYSVQLLQEGVAAGEPVTTTSLQLEMDTADTTSSYSVTVAAVNNASLKSTASEPSDPISAKKKAAATVEIPAVSPPAGGGTDRTPASGGTDKTPAVDGAVKTPAASTEKTPETNTEKTPSVSTPAINQLQMLVSPSPVVPAYTKVIKTKSKVTSKTLVALSKLTVAKTSKTSFKLATASKKYCQLNGSTLKNIKKGTCLVTVTVTTKAGKKKSRTVKLIAR